MRRAFLRDGVIYGGVALLSGASSAFLVALYTRSIDRSAYGVVEYVAVLQLLIQVIVGLELTQGIARFYGGAETSDERRSFASTGLWSLVGAYGVVCAGLFLAADPIERALFVGTVPRGTLRPALISVFLGVMFYAVRSQLRWELRAFRYALATVLSLLLTIGAATFLLLMLHTGVIGVFVAVSIGNAGGLVACLYGLRATYRWSFDATKLRTMLRFSLPLTVSSLALFAASYGDRLIVRSALGFDDLGTYAAGAKLAALISLTSAGFQLGAAPLIYRHYKEAGTPATLAQLLRLFLCAGLVGVVILTGISREIIGIFAPAEYADAHRVMPILALATVLASGYIFLPGLTILNLTSRFAAISIAAAGVSLLLMALLAPAYGIVGAALGVLGGASAGFGLHAVFSQQTYALPVVWWRVLVALAVALATIAVEVIGHDGSHTLVARMTITVAAGTSVLMLLLTASDRALIARAVSVRSWSVSGRSGS